MIFEGAIPVSLVLMPRERAAIGLARWFPNHVAPASDAFEFESEQNPRELATVTPERSLAQFGELQLGKQDLLLRIYFGAAVGTNYVDECTRHRIDALGKHPVVNLAQPGEFFIAGDALDRGKTA